MGIIKNIRDGIHTAARIYEYSDEEKHTERETLQFLWNYQMYEILVDFQVAQKYFGGKNLWHYRNGRFPETLRGDRDWYAHGFVPSVETRRLIWDAWCEDDLFGNVLDGNPGVLADIGQNSVAWFDLLSSKTLFEASQEAGIEAWDSYGVTVKLERKWADMDRRGAPWNEGLPGAADPENSKYRGPCPNDEGEFHRIEIFSFSK